MSEPGPAGWPDVDVIMPVRDEARHLETAVSAIIGQRYDGRMRVYLAVGPSSDGTEQIARRLTLDHERIHVVENPAGTTPAGLNAAIDASSAPVIVRADGHCELSAGYIARAVSTLLATGAANVGGVQRPQGESDFERAVAAAMSSRFGTGGSRFHVGGRAGPVDTVYLGVFRRAPLVEVGGFDETLLRNQDYELNFRLRRAGHVVWFDPELWATYRPRSTLRSLARQYYEYGRYKRQVIARHPSSLKLRQAIPPVACGGAVIGLLAVPWVPKALVLPAGYAAAVGGAAALEGRKRRTGAWRIAAALATIHFSWSMGLVRGAGGSSSHRRPNHELSS